MVSVTRTGSFSSMVGVSLVKVSVTVTVPGSLGRSSLLCSSGPVHAVRKQASTAAQAMVVLRVGVSRSSVMVSMVAEPTRAGGEKCLDLFTHSARR
ncbi:MAG: hypothetical protein WKF76_06975 [Nocardioidaceae bacterium]